MVEYVSGVTRIQMLKTPSSSLTSILGIQTKTVAIYIDFENIAISLNEQGYAVNLDRLIEGINLHASAHGQIPRMAAYARSEERRVGKECRSRWSPYH